MPAYRDEKNNSWYAKFNYKNWKGETKFTTKRGFATKREAVEYENEFKKHIAGDLDMNFEEFVKLYREDHYPRIRVSTAANKDNIINTKLIPYFKKFKITEIKAKDIVKWQNTLLNYRNPQTGKPYSKTYLKTVHNQLSAIMNFAVKYYDLSENPVEKAGSIGISNAEEMQFWTLDEYLQFADAMMEEPFFYYCFEVLYWGGLREGELLALTYDDFDFVNKTISVTKTYQVIKGKEIIGPTKTAKGTRIVSMPDRLCDEMKDYFKMCYNKENTRAFPTSKSVLTRAMARGTKKAGVKKIRIHDLRHSHVSLLINLGFSAVDIAKRVGHESITITLRYAHMFPSAQAQMMNKINNLLNEETEV
ncbi:MAG: tyrosine-type recombinase/integrase [Lachnospiraceae bacterium]